MTTNHTRFDSLLKQKHINIFYYIHLNKFEESLIAMGNGLPILSDITLLHYRDLTEKNDKENQDIPLETGAEAL